MLPIFRQLIRSGIYYGAYEVLWRGEKSKAGLRKVLAGGLLLMLAVPLAFVGILALVAALFFGLADAQTWVEPALISAVVVWLIVALLVYQGWRKLKR